MNEDDLIVQGIAAEDIEPGEVCQVVGFTAKEAKKSPVPVFKKVGAGALRPAFIDAANPGVAPAGTLCVVDVPCAPEYLIQYALEAPAKALALAQHRAVPSEGPIERYGDWFLQQCNALIFIAAERLDRAPSRGSGEDAALWVRAHEALEFLNEWITYVMLGRTGGSVDAPIQVPAVVARKTLVLARIGKRLRIHEQRRMRLASLEGGGWSEHPANAGEDSACSQAAWSWGEFSPKERERKALEYARRIKAGGIAAVSKALADDSRPTVSPEGVRAWIKRRPGLKSKMARIQAN